MILLHNNKIGSVFAMMLCVGLLSACQPQNDSNAAKNEETAKPAQVVQTLPLIEAKVRPLQLARSIACDEEGCTKYQLYSLDTNVPWINQYFDERMKKANPVAFESSKQSHRLMKTCSVKLCLMSVMWRSVANMLILS
jgi:hypothetical protein